MARAPVKAAVPVVAMATAKTGSGWVANRSARASSRVRSMVGHRVIRVPAAVRPTQPSTSTVVCATRSLACHASSWPRARMAPRVAPIGTQAAAAR